MDEELESEIKTLVVQGRAVEAQLFRKMHALHSTAEDPTDSIKFLIGVLGKSRRTVYNYISLGEALTEGVLTEMDVLTQGPTKLLLTKDQWGGVSAPKTPTDTSQTLVDRHEDLTCINLRYTTEERDILYSALHLAGATHYGSGMQNKERALLRILHEWSELSAQAD